ncbi:hypothetical protein Mapa_011099 [Marchantia paleacea]|nr:hypothetical protein Mapa_011099 [Marchantia paleacea]
MYRPASRFDSRIQEKPSRSTRSTWGDNRSFTTPLEADDGTRSAPYMTEESMMDRELQSLRGNNDLREAQRLAASFFSSQIPPSSSTPVYRDGRPTRTMSPEPPMDRFGSQSSRHYREREANDEQRWPSNRSTSQERYLSSRTLTEPEVWEEADAYGVAGSRSRKREDTYGWEEVDLEYAARKETEYPMHGETEAVRVTKRVDWTGLFRDGREVGGADSSLGKRSLPGYGGRQFGESYLSGQDDLMDPEEAVFSSRGRDPHENLRKGRGYPDEVPDALEEYGLGSSLGAARGVGRAGQRDMDWGRDGSRHEEREFWHSGMRTNGMNEVSELSRGYGDGPSTFPLNRGTAPMGRRGLINPKPDYSVRASLTNRDILGYYYGNANHQPRNDYPRRGGAPFVRNDRIPYGGVPGPWHGASRPPGGGPDRDREDWGSFRKGKKRWPKSPKAGDSPHVSHTSHGKRFKRETEADKLFLMHNSKATSVPKDEPRETPDQPHPSEKGKEKEEMITPTKDESEKRTEAEGKSVEKGLWDNDDSWSDSEEEKVAGVDVSRKDETVATSIAPLGELENAASQAPQASAPNEPEKPSGDRSAAAEYDADWESLASDTDEHMDCKVAKQDVDAEANRSSSSGNEDVGTIPTASQSEPSDFERGDARIVGNEDLEMFDADETGEGSRVELSMDAKISGGSSDKGLAPEAQHGGKVMEDKAYDFYISVFEQDADLRKLYEANVNSGSFECLVCAGIGAKKKKRFPDVASMVQHAKKILRTKKLPEHRGFARAVCHVLGWDATVCSPSPKTTVSRGWLAPQEQYAPTLQLNDVPKTQVSSNVAADANWDLESARRLLEEQLKELENDSSLPETLVQTKVGTGSSKSVSHEKGKDVETGDGSTTNATLVEISAHGDKANLTEGKSFANSVNNDIAQMSAEDPTNDTAGGPEANATGNN